MTKERVMEIFAKYIDKELDHAELEYVRETLIDVCECTKEELVELGFLEWLNFEDYFEEE